MKSRIHIGWWLMAIAAPITANAQHQDVELSVVDNVLVTQQRIYDDEFDLLAGRWFTDDPGFEAADGTFTPGELFGAQVVDKLWYWDGDQIGSASGAPMLAVNFQGETKASVSQTSQQSDGFFFAEAGENGGVHRHLAFELSPSHAPAGAYGIVLRAISSLHTQSDPFLIVFGLFDEELTDDEFFAGIDAIAEASRIFNPGLEGDTNQDGLVNVSDLNAVRNNFGATGPDDGTLAGDAVPVDGQVNVGDLNLVRNNFGASIESISVPEPSSVLLLSTVAIGMLFAVRRRRQPGVRTCTVTTGVPRRPFIALVSAMFQGRASSTMSSEKLRAGISLAVLICSCSWAAAQHADLEIDNTGGALAVEPAVVEGEFGEGLNPAYRADDPGFDAEDTLPAGEILGFRVPSFSIGGTSRNFWYWDGSGAVEFGAPPASHHLNVLHFGSVQDIATDGDGLLDGTDQDLTGFVFGVADGGGGFHDHLAFDLTDNTGSAGSIASPDDGVYLWAMHLTGSSLTESNRFFWVMATGVDEAVHEAAAVHVEQTLVPEPATWLLACIASICLLTSRRQLNPRPIR